MSPPRSKRGRILLILAGAGLLLAAGLTAVMSFGAEALHHGLMQRIAATGLAEPQALEFRRGWLRSHSAGELRLADSLCAPCKRLTFAGMLAQGAGAWLGGHWTLARASYAIALPDLPVEPRLPRLSLTAEQGLWSGLIARVALPAASSGFSVAARDYRLSQQGIAGRLESARLALRSPRLALQRDGRPWFSLDGLRLDAAAVDALTVGLAAQELEVAAWQWLAEGLRIEYRQQEFSRRLSFDAAASVASGTVAARAHERAEAGLAVERLDLAATRALVEALPTLLDTGGSPAGRMFKLLSLYSVHGPALFGPAPRLALRAEDLPLPAGPADLRITLRVQENLRRAPMHPQEWRDALDLDVDITAPAAVLRDWWAWAGGFVSWITGLPVDYQALGAAGWVRPAADGRDRLRLALTDGQLSRPTR